MQRQSSPSLFRWARLPTIRLGLAVKIEPKQKVSFALRGSRAGVTHSHVRHRSLLVRGWSDRVERAAANAFTPARAMMSAVEMARDNSAAAVRLSMRAAGGARRTAAAGSRLRTYFTRRFSADSLPRLETISNVTLAPSGRPSRPAFSTAEIWTKTSLPPPSGAMKP